MAANKFRIALIQLLVSAERKTDLQRAESMIGEAAKKGAKLVALPEYFTCLLDLQCILDAREKIPGPTTEFMSEVAKKHKVFLAAGSIPETVEGSEKLYNTCPIFNPQGDLIAKHRKLHMFDAKFGGDLDIAESDINRAGDEFTVFDTGYCRVGVGVCIDLRYNELSRIYCDKGAKLLLYTGAFSARKTGPAHWEILARARAIDNQVYVAACSPAVDETQHYVPWGHSSIIDPWGTVIAGDKPEEGIVYGELDLDYLHQVRNSLPLDNLRRNDLYRTITLKE